MRLGLLIKLAIREASICGRPSVSISKRWFSDAAVALKHEPKKKIDSRKEEYNVGTIGHIDHGKTTLTAAITKVLSQHSKGKTKFMAYDDIDRASEEKKRGITIHIAHVSYDTEKRHYSHTDCPGHKDFIKNMICGTNQMDAAILVIAATDGVMPQTKEHVMLAKRIGVPHIIVFVNKCDTVDEEMAQLVELESRELLSQFQFQESQIQVVRGSALCALENENPEMGEKAILKLMECMDGLPTPKRDFEGSFCMPVQSSVSIMGRGTVVIGTVLRGTLNKGDIFELVGFGKTSKFTASDIQMFNQPKSQVKAGDHCGILCRGLKMENVRRGYWLSTPGAVKLVNTFKAECYMLTKIEGGMDRAIRSAFHTILRCTTWEQSFKLFLPDSGPQAVDMIMPGDHATVYFTLQQPMPLEVGRVLTIMMGRNTIMSAVVSEILPNLPVENMEDLTRVQIKDCNLTMKAKK